MKKKRFILIGKLYEGEDNETLKGRFDGDVYLLDAVKKITGFPEKMDWYFEAEKVSKEQNITMDEAIKYVIEELYGWDMDEAFSFDTMVGMDTWDTLILIDCETGKVIDLHDNFGNLDDSKLEDLVKLYGDTIELAEEKED